MTAQAVGFGVDLDAARAGDRAAFGRLVQQHRNLVSSIALSIVRDVSTSEDVAQEVFVAAWHRLGELRNPASLLPWLRQITRNRARDLRASGRRMVPDEEAVSSAVDPGDLPKRLELSEQEQVLTECLDALTDDDREVVTLFYREGQSIKQVAVLLELTEDAVKKRLSRARERLRESVMARFGEAAEATRPTEAFTRGVLAALPLGTTPGLLSAGALGGLAKFAPLLGGAALGLSSSLYGIWSGVRSGLKVARDERERRDLRRYGWASTALVTTFMVAFVIAMTAGAPRWVIVAQWGFFAVGMQAMCSVWMPRIISRRLAAELAEDPGVAAKQRRNRRIARISNVFAYTAGSVPIVLYGFGIIGRGP